jgi:hypothetical protein
VNPEDDVKGVICCERLHLGITEQS